MSDTLEISKVETGQGTRKAPKVKCGVMDPDKKEGRGGQRGSQVI